MTREPGRMEIPGEWLRKSVLRNKWTSAGIALGMISSAVTAIAVSRKIRDQGAIQDAHNIFASIAETAQDMRAAGEDPYTFFKSLPAERRRARGFELIARATGQEVPIHHPRLVRRPLVRASEWHLVGPFYYQRVMLDVPATAEQRACRRVFSAVVGRDNSLSLIQDRWDEEDAPANVRRIVLMYPALVSLRDAESPLSSTELAD